MIVLDAAAVLFDSDGVLVDSHQAVDRAWRQLAVEFGLDADRLVDYPGVRAQEVLSRFLPVDLVRQAAARFEDLEVELVGGVEPLPGALELTSQIPPIRWAIVTSAARRLATARWAEAGIVVPPTTVTADDVPRGKPDPAPYIKAAESLKVDPTRCVVLEDSPSGGKAASAMGATVIAVGDHQWPTEPKLRVRGLNQIGYAEPKNQRMPATLTIRPHT